MFRLMQHISNNFIFGKPILITGCVRLNIRSFNINGNKCLLRKMTHPPHQNTPSSNLTFTNPLLLYKGNFNIFLELPETFRCILQIYSHSVISNSTNILNFEKIQDLPSFLAQQCQLKIKPSLTKIVIRSYCILLIIYLKLNQNWLKIFAY